MYVDVPLNNHKEQLRMLSMLTAKGCRKMSTVEGLKQLIYDDIEIMFSLMGIFKNT